MNKQKWTVNGHSISAKGMGHIAKVLPVEGNKNERLKRAERIVSCVNALAGIEDVKEYRYKNDLMNKWVKALINRETGLHSFTMAMQALFPPTTNNTDMEQGS